MVMAYRVEYPTSYKTQLNTDESRVTGFNGINDNYGINISFVLPDHSEHFSNDRTDLRGLRIVTFELHDDLWHAIEWKASNKGAKSSINRRWLNAVENLKSPSWSDGASLSKFIKQTALAFNNAWFDVLAGGVINTASVYYPGDDETGLKNTDLVWAYNDELEEGETLADVLREGFEYSLKDSKDGKFAYMTLEKAYRLGYYDGE